jgi:hypothetical protein
MLPAHTHHLYPMELQQLVQGQMQGQVQVQVQVQVLEKGQVELELQELLEFGQVAAEPLQRPVQFLMRMELGLLVPLSGDNIMPCKLMNSTDHHHQHSFTSIFKFIPALDKPSKSLLRN